MGSFLLTSIATQVSTITILTIVVLVVVATNPSNQVNRQGCPGKCGDVVIPYPFGIGNDCSYGFYYNITCNNTFHPPRPFYGNMEVFDIGLFDGKIRITNFVSEVCYAMNGTQTWKNTPSLEMNRFKISSSDNVFAATGCDTIAWFWGTRYGRPYSLGCMTMCYTQEDVVNGTCSGVGCCQSAVPDGITQTKIDARSYYNHTNVSSFKPCSSAFVVAKDALNFTLANLTTPAPQDINAVPKFPVIFDWRMGTINCSEAHANGTYICKGNSTCYDFELPDSGYLCHCKPGYSGNPYLEACQGIAGAVIVFLMIAIMFYWRYQKNQLEKERESFFKQNGGDLLHQKLSDGQDVSVDMIKIFKTDELEKATDRYSTVIGKGGFGMVYKGVLPNNQVVAIKKSLKVDPKQSEQFVNEVIILSKLNHRNVVKLIDCCMETEVPLLVYEFIDNETLHHHLHDDARASRLTWSIRLKIASEVAEVLSYLHTAIDMPIIHRDMKTTNILLDRNYTAKVSDFGDSRLVPIDQDHLATVVIGTWGYLDASYMQTQELTQKSDVYSFGVVLVELLTRQKVISPDRPEEDKCLTLFFIRKLNEGCLIEILDDIVLREDGTFQQVMGVANLAYRCLNPKAEKRPTMKEVAIELHRIKEMEVQHPC